MNKEGNSTGMGRGRRWRNRVKRGLSTPTGRAVGVGSIVAPVVGYLIHDLQKPDSVVRKLVGSAVNRALEWKRQKREQLDITDKVGITIDDRET